jgi:hypothetical protein
MDFIEWKGGLLWWFVVLEGRSDWPISTYSYPIEGESGRIDFMEYLYDWRGVQDGRIR